MELNGSFSHEYLFLPYLAFYVICVFLSVCFVCQLFLDTKNYALLSPHRLRRRHRKKGCVSCAQIIEDFRRCFCCCFVCDEYHCCGVSLPIFVGESLTQSWDLIGIFGPFLLLLTRILSFLFLIYYVVLSYADRESAELNKLSSWTNLAATLVFSLLVVSSFLNTLNHFLCGVEEGRRHPSGWSIFLQRAALTLHYLYQCVLGNTIFIAIMEYLYQQHFRDRGQPSFDLSFTNTKQHLIPAGLLVLDLFLSISPVRLEHYYVSLALPTAYLIYQWISVVTGQINWQYTFLQTSRARCFGVYSLLFLIHVGCFFGSYLLALIRDYLFNVSYEKRYRLLQSESDEFDVANRNEEDEESNVEFSDVYASNDRGMFVGSFEDINVEGDGETALSPEAHQSFRHSASAPLPVLPPNSLPPMATIDLPMAIPVSDAGPQPAYRRRY
eukprot:gene8214-8884_t